MFVFIFFLNLFFGVLVKLAVIMSCFLTGWTRLFKTNDVVKFSEVNFSIMPIFFVEKCEKSAKAFLIFSTKSISVFGYILVKQ